MHNRMFASLKALLCMTCALLVALRCSASEPVELARGSGRSNPQQPQVAVASNGDIHVVYGIGDKVRYHRSIDGGKSFSKPVELSFATSMSLGMRRGPRIAVTDKEICISAIGGKQGKGRDGDLLLMRSVDQGKTWTGPFQVNDVDHSAREGLHAMAAGLNGHISCVWLDLRNRATDVMASTSTDGGQNWGKNTLVYKSPTGSVCECCHPSITFDADGRVYVQWRNALAGKRDIYVATSSDGGKTFDDATKLGEGTWPLDACPMDGGAIAISAGKVISVWRREKSVFVSEAGHTKERLLGHGEQPWVAATGKGAFIVWLTKRGAEAWLLAPGKNKPVLLAGSASDPVVASHLSGSGPVVAAWETEIRKNTAIVCRVLSP